MILKLFKLIHKEHTVGNPPKKKGQRVLLVHDSPYIPDNANPKEGSSYHCEGVVVAIMIHPIGGHERIVIQWDNGARNDYRAIELKVIPFIPDSNWQSSLDSDNPNITFKQNKQSRELKERVFEKTRKPEMSPSYYNVTTSNYTWS